jgi:hypothetical protein
MVSPADLYKDFVKWTEEEGIRKKMSKNKFGEHLSTRIQQYLFIEAMVWWQGLKPQQKWFEDGLVQNTN